MVDKLATKWLDANEIKANLSIERVLDHYGVLASMRRSGGTLRGLSPFREERVPSFSVNVSRNVWNDHPRPIVAGEIVKGNVIGLVQAFEQCSFREALERAYEIAGVEPDEPTPSSDTTTNAQRETRARVEAVVSDEPPAANEVFGKTLRLKHDHPYLATRGLAPKRAQYWGIGWVPRGLLRGRIGVPIRNREGDIVAYMGRTLKGCGSIWAT